MSVEVENPLLDILFSESERLQESALESQQPEKQPLSPIHDPPSDLCSKQPLGGIPDFPQIITNSLEKELDDCLEDADVELPNPVTADADETGDQPRMGRLRRLVRDDTRGQEVIDDAIKPKDDDDLPVKRPIKNRITVKPVALQDGEEDDELGLTNIDDEQAEDSADGAVGGRRFTERMASDDQSGGEEGGEDEEEEGYWDSEDELVEQLLNPDEGEESIALYLYKLQLIQP